MPTKYSTAILTLFAQNLVRIRKNVGLSQKDLADLAGLTHNFVNDLENGKKGFSLDTLGRLSETLKVEPFHFFINKDQWADSEKLQYQAVLSELNTGINKLFENYRC